MAHIGLVPVYALPETAGEHYRQIRASLHKLEQPIGNSGLWLAAHARAEDWILVTNSEREFVRVPGLQVENRAKPTRDSGSSQE